MFKQLFKVFLNQLKVKGFQLMLETLTATMLEFNRKSQMGDFDIKPNSQPTNGGVSPFNVHNSNPEPKKTGFFGLFK